MDKFSLEKKISGHFRGIVEKYDVWKNVLSQEVHKLRPAENK